MEKPTSLKQIFQGMQVKDMEVHEGIVVSEAPLQIKLINNEKMIVDEDIAIVPMHLTDYITTCDLTMIGETGVSNTITEDSARVWISKPISDEVIGSHFHRLEALNVTKIQIKVHNHLKKDERVYLLSYNNGKVYYVLDRVVK